MFSLIKKTPINLGEYGGFNTCINCGEDTYKSGWGCSKEVVPHVWTTKSLFISDIPL